MRARTKLTVLVGIATAMLGTSAGLHAQLSSARDPGPRGGPPAAGGSLGTHVARDNVSFRIPTPTFGGGLVEAIPDSAILANRAAYAATKAAAGIPGRPNRNGNDGTITRFGWKAQNKSLLLFSGEGAALAALSAIEKFAFFMRFLAPPTPSTAAPGGAASIAHGRQPFMSTGCALCHTPTLSTGNAGVAALANREVDLYSDLLLHGMGPDLADDIVQGEAGPDEFRTAPLWGLGQRIFFLHDGRTTDLGEAIRAHRSGAGGGFRASEANVVIDRYNALGERDRQDLFNFLRSL